MKSYSPVDNIHAADYPHILVTAGLHDPRVGARGAKAAGDRVCGRFSMPLT